MKDFNGQMLITCNKCIEKRSETTTQFIIQAMLKRDNLSTNAKNKFR